MKKENVHKYMMFFAFVLIAVCSALAQTNAGFGKSCNIAQQSCDNIVQNFYSDFAVLNWHKLPLQQDICLRFTAISKMNIPEGVAQGQEHFLIYGCSLSKDGIINLNGIFLSDALRSTGGDLAKTLFLFVDLSNNKPVKATLPKYGLIIGVQKRIITVNNI